MLSAAPILSLPQSTASARPGRGVDVSGGLGSCRRGGACHSTEMLSRQSSAVPHHGNATWASFPQPQPPVSLRLLYPRLSPPFQIEPSLFSLPASKTQISVIFLLRFFSFFLGTKVGFWKVKEMSHCVFLNKRNQILLFPPSATQRSGRSFEMTGSLNMPDSSQVQNEPHLPMGFSLSDSLWCPWPKGWFCPATAHWLALRGPGLHSLLFLGVGLIHCLFVLCTLQGTNLYFATQFVISLTMSLIQVHVEGSALGWFLGGGRGI